MSVLMTPDMSNFSGKVHGGAVLRLLDHVAYACASRYARSYVVTMSVDRVIFREPIHVGELVDFLASVNYTGTTSMEIGIRVEAENVQRGIRRHVNSSYFTMVAVDDNGAPTVVTAIRPRDPDGEQRYESAQRRRKAMRELHTHNLPASAPNA